MPSLPGYGFSGKPSATGWGIGKIAQAWDTLMTRLGYDRYGAQGGDWGAAVTTQIGRNVGSCVGIHVNMPIAQPPAEGIGEMTEDLQAALARIDYYRKWDSGYMKQQSTRPQTVGYGLVDSLSVNWRWIVEKFWSWMDCDGHPENVLSRGRAARQRHALLGHRIGGVVGPAVLGKRTTRWAAATTSACPPVSPRSRMEILRAPRSWCETGYNVTHFTTMPQRRTLRRLRAAGIVRRRCEDVLRHRAVTVLASWAWTCWCVPVLSRP